MPSLITLPSEEQQCIELHLERYIQQKTDEDLFYELCFCILTPQSSAFRCASAVAVLRARDFYHTPLNTIPILRTRTRFHNHKAAYLLTLRTLFPSFLQYRSHCSDPVLLREWLVMHVKGMGYKEASHYLRNIGYRGLAILDRHILRCLYHYGVLSSVPKILSSQQYKQIESRFISFAERTQIPLDVLDLLFWSRATGVLFK